MTAKALGQVDPGYEPEGETHYRDGEEADETDQRTDKDCAPGDPSLVKSPAGDEVFADLGSNGQQGGDPEDDPGQRMLFDEGPYAHCSPDEKEAGKDGHHDPRQPQDDGNTDQQKTDGVHRGDVGSSSDSFLTANKCSIR